MVIPELVRQTFHKILKKHSHVFLLINEEYLIIPNVFLVRRCFVDFFGRSLQCQHWGALIILYFLPRTNARLPFAIVIIVIRGSGGLFLRCCAKSNVTT